MSDVRALLSAASAKLAAAGIENPRLDARVLLAHARGVPAEEIVLSEDISADALTLFDASIARRAAREPVAYIIGAKEFWSLVFETGPGALVPRPQSETLIEQMLGAFPDRQAPLEVLDLGVGTGCLLIAVLKIFPNAKGVGLDASQAALGWAGRNVARHGLEPRCQLIRGDWSRDSLPQADAILANPPYIRTEDIALLAPEVRREPNEALDGGADGLDAYRALAPRLGSWLKPQGRTFLEIGAGQGRQVTAVLEAEGLKVEQSAPDLDGIARCIVVRRGS